MAETQFELPVPYIYDDGSVSTVPEQARGLARALNIAASLMVK